jgi:hypothetical protein
MNRFLSNTAIVITILGLAAPIGRAASRSRPEYDTLSPSSRVEDGKRLEEIRRAAELIRSLVPGEWTAGNFLEQVAGLGLTVPSRDERREVPAKTLGAALVVSEGRQKEIQDAMIQLRKMMLGEGPVALYLETMKELGLVLPPVKGPRVRSSNPRGRAPLEIRGRNYQRMQQAMRSLSRASLGEGPISLYLDEMEKLGFRMPRRSRGDSGRPSRAVTDTNSPGPRADFLVLNDEKLRAVRDASERLRSMCLGEGPLMLFLDRLEELGFKMPASSGGFARRFLEKSRSRVSAIWNGVFSGNLFGVSS